LEYITRIGEGCGWLPDCEELVGGTHLVKSDAFPIYHSPRKKTAYPPGCVNFIVRCLEY